MNQARTTQLAEALGAALTPFVSSDMPRAEIAATLLSFAAGFALRVWDRATVEQAQAVALEEHAP